MKNFLLFLFLGSAAMASAQDSLGIVKFTSLHGTTGVFKTSDATTIGRWKGSIGLFESFRIDSLDQVVFNIGVHERLEVGIQSGIPAHSYSKLNFLFKFQGTQQGNFFGLRHRLLPATAVGINQHSTFAVASYAVKKVVVSVGYHFSDHKESVFGNISFHPIPFIALQAEYFKDHLGGAIRFKYRNFVASLLASYDLETKKLPSSRAYWNIAFYF